MVRRAFVLLAGTVALAACADMRAGTGYQPPGTLAVPQPLPGTVAPGAPVAPTPPAGPAVALLAPLTGPNAERGQALAQAAQLALSVPGAPHLDVRDTASTPAGAQAAAQAALAAGDGMILGPLTAAETAAVAGPARAANVLVLAFTNDAAQAQPGVWTLGITPAQQVRRLVGAVMAQGKSRFAAVLPPGNFGAAMGTALTRALESAGAPPANVRVHDGSNAGIAASMREAADYADRRGPIDAKIKAARAQHTAEGRKEAAELARTPIPPPPFDALLLADTGDKLAWAATFLGYYDIGPSQVRLLGPALWASPAGRGGADVNGAWFAAPDPAARTAFTAAYQGQYNAAAPGLADFAYDAASIARVLAASGGYTAGSLCRPEGFAGADGVLAFQPDGSVRRGLAVFEIHPDGPAIVDPAPATLAAPGI